MSMRKSASLVVGLFFFIPQAIFATPINVDFGDQGGTPSNVYGAASGQVGAWNVITSIGMTSNLVDLAGVATAVSVTTAVLSYRSSGREAKRAPPPV